MKRFFLCAGLVAACSARSGGDLPGVSVDSGVATDRGTTPVTDLGTTPTDVPTKGADVPGVDVPAPVDAGFPVDVPGPVDLGPSCTSDRECSAAGLVCDTDRSVCVECVRTDDCLVTGQSCVGNRCVAGFDSGPPPVDAVFPTDRGTVTTDRGNPGLTDRGMTPDVGPGATLLVGFGGANGYGPAENCIAPSDDGSFGAAGDGGTGAGRPIPLGAGFGTGLLLSARRFTAFYLNNNGNISFGADLVDYTADRFPRPSGSTPMIAPWWSDVDTRGGGQPSQNQVCFVSEPSRLVATWHRVGYYNAHNDRQNSFQLIVTPAGAAGSGDFDVEFRYGLCQWTTGDASGGVGGLGGTPAQAGIDHGDAVNSVSLPGSRTADVLYLCTSSNVGIPGVWRMQVRAGVPRTAP